MTGLMVVLLTLVGAGGLITVLVREPVRQAISLGILGMLLALLFFVLQAPDVALSEIVVGSIALPGMLLLAIAKVRQHEADDEEEQR